MAILSRLPFSTVDERELLRQERFAPHRRDVRQRAGLRTPTLHNFYVPAGGDEPDPDVNENSPTNSHSSTKWPQCVGAAPGKGRAILVGDLNVAPFETRRLEPQAAPKVVSPYADRVEKLKAVQQPAHWIDVMRGLCRNQKALHVVELSRPIGTRPTRDGGSIISGSSPAVADRVAAHDGAQAGARLGAAVGSRPGHGGSRIIAGEIELIVGDPDGRAYCAPR